MKNQFIEAVKSHDLISVRLFLSNELLLDPRGNSFDEMLKLAEDQCPDLYENEASSFVLRKNSNQWDQEYLNELKNEVDTHFRKDTLHHYKEVAKFVLKDKASNLDNEEKQKPRFVISEKEKDTYQKVAYGSLIGGGATIAITGLCLSKWTMAGFGLVCIAAGGYLVYKLIKE